MEIRKIYYILAVVLFTNIIGCSRSYNEPLKIVFQRGSQGVLPSNIWIINYDGNDEKQLTSQNTDHSPSWSPDCSSIVFIRNTDIYKMNNGGSALQLVISIGNCRYPTWSPEGNDILFSYFDTTFFRIFRIKSNGTGMIALTGLADDYMTPSWSPDGSTIVMCDGSGPSVVIGDADAESVPVTLVASIASESPTWSPDGGKILYVDNNQIYSVNKDGTGVTQLTSDIWTNRSPAWSPDGEKIVFSSDEPGGFPYQLYIMNSDGSERKRLTYSGIDEDNPCFQGKPR